MDLRKFSFAAELSKKLNEKLFAHKKLMEKFSFPPPLLALMYAEQIRKIGDQPLRDILKTLGGWPVIEPNWKPPNISIEKLMGILRGEYSEPVLIELYVGADDKNSSINILQVRKRRKYFSFSIYPHIFSI